MRNAAKRLLGENRRVQAVELAWLCQQLGDQPLADEMLMGVMTSVTGKDRFAVTLAAIEYLWATSQHARAEALLKPLLDDEQYAKKASLWRLAAQLAAQRGMLAQSLSCTEKAMQLEFEALPDIINLQSVRQEYGGVMSRYQQLANAVATLQAKPPVEFVARVVRMADRWRALDDDDTAACQAAARVLQRIGAVDLAWEYLTTPLADRPNEAQPWLNLAQVFRNDGDFELADKAYDEAYKTEPTNAQILWNRAQNLMQAGRLPEARQIYQQIATGEWQPRFQGLKSQAQRFLDDR
jgi:tetratricopeptide (TPR) repeat protein